VITVLLTPPPHAQTGRHAEIPAVVRMGKTNGGW
jgi:hypothetical protein